MVFLYIFILLAFTNSYQYQIIDLKPYRYIHYTDDLVKTKDNIVIYKYQTKSTERKIYISFLGDSKYGFFDFYLYSDISEINYDEDKSLTNYIDNFDNFGEIKINYDFDTYYILVKMKWFEDKSKYLSFMIYNLNEYMDI